jgi:hypothetical protein
MRLDLMLPAAEKLVLVLEGIGDDKIRINSSSLDQPLTILSDQAREIVAIAKITIRAGSCVSLLTQLMPWAWPRWATGRNEIVTV